VAGGICPMGLLAAGRAWVGTVTADGPDPGLILDEWNNVIGAEYGVSRAL
jgi:hypothetical protein